MPTLNFNTVAYNPVPARVHLKNLTGQTFGHLLVLGLYGRDTHHKTVWLCQCVCRTIILKVSSELSRQKRPPHCGRLHANKSSIRKKYSCTTEQYAYYAMRGRCNNPRNKDYHNYGGRGIKCLITSVQELIDTVGLRPSPKYSIDRIDNDGHYEKGNLRWATPKEQLQNQRNREYITIGNISKTLSEWCDVYHIRKDCVYARLRRGWGAFDALTAPLHTRLLSLP